VDFMTASFSGPAIAVGPSLTIRSGFGREKVQRVGQEIRGGPCKWGL
jgi:hypothetical protein